MATRDDLNALVANSPRVSNVSRQNLNYRLDEGLMTPDEAIELVNSVNAADSTPREEPVELDRSAATPFGRTVIDTADNPLELKLNGKPLFADEATPEVLPVSEPTLGASRDTLEEPQRVPGVFGFGPSETASAPRDLVRRDGQAVSDLSIVEDIKRREDISYLDSLTAGFLNYNTAGRAFASAGDDTFILDPEYGPDQVMEQASLPDISPRIAALGEPEAVAEYLGDAISRDHFNFLLERLEKEQENNRIAGEHWSAAVIASIVDPTDIAVTGAAAVLGVPGLGYARKASRLARGLGSAATAGTANAAIEAQIAAESPFVDGEQIALAGIFGIAIGGPLGSLGRGLDEQLEAAAERAARDAVDVPAGRSSPPPTSAGAAGRTIDENIEGVRSSPLAEQAAENQGITRPIDDREFRFEFLQKFQRNLIGRTFFSASRTVQDIAVRMMEGGHKARGTVREFTAELRAQHIDRSFTNESRKAVYEDFNKWSDENGFGVTNRNMGTEAGRQFWTDVTTGLRGGATRSPHAAAAAAKLRPLLDDYWMQAQRAGVAGFEGDPLPNYVPRMYDFDKWVNMLDEVGEPNMVAFFRENLLANEAIDITDEIAEKIAKGMVRSTIRRQAGMDQTLIHGIPMHDMDELRKFLNPANDPADEILANDVIELLENLEAERNAGRNVGEVRHAQTRVQLDELYEATVALRDGSGTRTVTLADLTENDGQKLMARYSRVMSGHIGMAREAGIASRTDFDNKMQAILDEGVAEGRLAAAQDEVEALTIAYNSVTGQSLEADAFGTGAQASRTAMAFAYLANGGMMGLSQIPEMANVLAEGGIRQFVQYIPEFRSILRRARNGEIDGQLARDIDQMIAPGTDFFRNPAMANFDEAAGTMAHKSWVQGTLQRMDPSVKTGSRVMTALNLMAPINAAMQRAAAMATTVKHARIATGRRVPKAGDIERMRANGIDEAMQTRIYAAMNEATEWRGNKLEGINTERWQEIDSDSLDAWNMHNVRSMRQQIQENDIGNQAAAMNSTLGKTLVQFRTFTFQSVNKQLLHGVNHFDAQQAASWSTAVFLASLVYVGRTSVEFANDPEERKKRLTLEAIAAAGIGRSGPGAILPMVIDTPLSLARMDPMFGSSRNSGLPSDFIGGNPVISMADKTLRNLFLPFAVAQGDYSFSEEDANRILRQVPYHNLLGIRNATSALTAPLPDTSRE